MGLCFRVCMCVSVWVGHLTVLCCCCCCFTFFLPFKYFHPCKIVSHLHTKNLAISKSSSEILNFSLFVWLIAAAAAATAAAAAAQVAATERFLISSRLRSLIAALMWPTLNSGHCEFHMQEQKNKKQQHKLVIRMCVEEQLRRVRCVLAKLELISKT